MAIRTGVVAINAAFMQELKEDNRDLHALLDRVTELTESRPVYRMRRQDLRNLVQVLEQLKDRLAMHFSLEEAYGYFDDAISVAPRLSERAELLRSQHEPLFVEICEIVDSAEPLLYRVATSREIGQLCFAFRSFRQRLEMHEGHETELVLSAFDDDIGCGD